MIKLNPLWMTTLLLFVSPVFAQTSSDTGSLAQRCLDKIINEEYVTPEMPSELKGSTLVAETVLEDRYEKKVGSQLIGTEISATIENHGGKGGKIVCLATDNKILYSQFFDID